MVGGKLISVIHRLAAAYSVLGVSATFRGEIGPTRLNRWFLNLFSSVLRFNVKRRR